MLPVLNNLLENREMHLEDGRLLIPAARFDSLLAEHGQEVRLCVSVSVSVKSSLGEEGCENSRMIITGYF